MKTLNQTYVIKASIEKVWDALVNPETIDKWGGGPVKMKAEESYQFSFWDGDIHGKNTKVVKEKELKQDWMSGKWDKYSGVTFKLSEKKGVTTIKLIHTDIPDNEYEDIAEGWKIYYLGEIKKFLEK